MQPHVPAAAVGAAGVPPGIGSFAGGQGNSFDLGGGGGGPSAVGDTRTSARIGGVNIGGGGSSGISIWAVIAICFCIGVVAFFVR